MSPGRYTRAEHEVHEILVRTLGPIRRVPQEHARKLVPMPRKQPQHRCSETDTVMANGWGETGTIPWFSLGEPHLG
jgi:hypothetical protein